MKTNVIFIMVDSNYFTLAIAFLNSIEKNWAEHPQIICHCRRLSTEQIGILNSYNKIKTVPIDLEGRENLLTVPLNRTPEMVITFFKLRMWSSEYDEYDNILYLDIDTLVLKPLTDLLNSDEFIIMKDPTLLYFTNKHPGFKNLLIEDGLSHHFNKKLEAMMVNAGVFLLPKKYRTPENYDYLQYLCNRYNPFNFFGDQSIISLWVLKNNILPTLDKSHNFFSVSFSNIEYDLSSIYLIHFVMTKPYEEKFMQWDALKTNQENLVETFNYYLNLKK